MTNEQAQKLCIFALICFAVAVGLFGFGILAIETFSDRMLAP